MATTKPLIRINAADFVQPSFGVAYETQQLVDAGRNANGAIISQKIGRRLFKFSNLTWNVLTYADWHTIRTALEGFSASCTYWDDYEDSEVTRNFYFGDSSATPFKFEDSTNVLKPTMYRDCKVNIIDMGE